MAKILIIGGGAAGMANNDEINLADNHEIQLTDPRKEKNTKD